jgi:hypothetical protein
MENCINILGEVLKDNEINLEEVSGLLINNTLPAELRSIAWRIILGILPKNKSPFEWVKIIRTERANFEKLNSDMEIELLTRIIRKELDDSNLPEGNLSHNYKLVVTELDRISLSYDFFKSQVVAETLLKLYVIWQKHDESNNRDDRANLNVFYILAAIIYSLYPSIIHFRSSFKEITCEDDTDSSSLFYFLNEEEYFDADVYLILFNLMKQKNLSEIINNSSKVNRQSIEVIQKRIIGNENLFPLSEQDNSFISSLGRVEKISCVYLKIVNHNLLNHLNSLNLDIYEIIQMWQTSFFTGTINFENLPYIWDNIFLNSTDDSLDFFDYVSLSLINNLSTELMTGDLNSCNSLLMMYPQNNLNLKEIMKKSFKIKEKVNDKFE